MGAPKLAGVVCVSESVCLDDLSQAQEATRLYSEAWAFVSENLGTVEGTPQVIFCSKQACADSFGLGARSAITFGTFGIVVGPRAWKPYYVRHELIHYMQGKRLGVLSLLLKPSWLIEGIAYGLSQDPRAPLTEPFETFRARFLSWYASINKSEVWQEAQKL